MNKKKIILLLTIIIVAAVAYFFFKSKDAAAPLTGKTETEIKNNNYVGMTVAEAEAMAQADGVVFRVVEEDGEIKPITRDLQVGRVNATVERGVVTSYSVESTDTTIEEIMGTGYVANNAIIGMTIAEAETYTKTKKIDFRIVLLDGKALPATADFRPGRISAEVKNGVVIGYTVE